MTTAEPILVFEEIAKRYGRTEVLHDISLVLASGDFAVIYGPPAAGKSVLMRVLMGLEDPDRGRVILRGEDVTTVSAADRNIGYVPQSFALYPHVSVRENIAYPLDLMRVPEAEAEPVVAHAAEMLRISDLLDKRPDQLSGGQKQRVAIARGIAKQTDLFVLDDPLAGLDFKLREQLVEDLRALQADTRATFLYTTSDVVEAMTLADTLALLDDGRIVEVGDPALLYARPQHLATMRLVGFPPANVLDGTIADKRDGLWCRTEVFDLPVELASVPDRLVKVAIRPEHVALSTGDETSAERVSGATHLPARIVLREDLGGEEIVYVETAGGTLTAVDRHTLDHGDLGQVTVELRPEHLAVFNGVTGERIGQGRAATAKVSVSHE